MLPPQSQDHSLDNPSSTGVITAEQEPLGENQVGGREQSISASHSSAGDGSRESASVQESEAILKATMRFRRFPSQVASSCKLTSWRLISTSKAVETDVPMRSWACCRLFTHGNVYAAPWHSLGLLNVLGLAAMHSFEHG
ncbi:hypothetical protein AAG906_001160 [Vitis piasezkii]